MTMLLIHLIGHTYSFPQYLWLLIHSALLFCFEIHAIDMGVIHKWLSLTLHVYIMKHVDYLVFCRVQLYREELFFLYFNGGF